MGEKDLHRIKSWYTCYVCYVILFYFCINRGMDLFPQRHIMSSPGGLRVLLQPQMGRDYYFTPITIVIYLTNLHCIYYYSFDMKSVSLLKSP